MDWTNIIAVIDVTSAAIQSSVQAIAASVGAVAGSRLDGCSLRTPREQQFTISRSHFTDTEQNEACDQAWYFDEFRCSKSSLDSILGIIED